jgi:PadR family transcriptional regulator
MTLHPPTRLAAGSPPKARNPVTHTSRQCSHVEAAPRPSSTYVAYMCRLYCMKLTGSLERVLRVLLADVSAQRYGYDLMKAAKLPSGTLYPMLARLEDEGLVTSEWESLPGDGSGRPPRKYYQLTGEGIRVARLELAQAPVPTRRVRHGTAQPTPGGTR